MADSIKEKPLKKDKKTGKQLQDGRGKEGKGRDMITSGYMDDIGHHEDNMPRIITVENTFQLGPNVPFPVSTAFNILQDVVTSHLQEEKYELQRARELSLTLCSIIRGRVKELLIPRYKIIVLIHIGQLFGQSMQISSRCLWDHSCDTFASYSYKNRSLFCVGNVYAVYFE